ncbi:alpha-1,4-glucan--maltose-1-phosphate maltosyltransferase [Propionivibrio sp.]|uniref:alpha-1,4-glucan--maltose-1-phosphate maltosyltransferase n=1 Tax=Propionivibrio sp. TaxID=2212460 RepID=UPI0026174437|nr:alpha-1,4-glucan--maltose-1-phosphate maltosyltransferase [Propionivibrio sp.]
MNKAVLNTASAMAPHHKAETVESALTVDLKSRPIVILNVSPEVDGGRYAIKREVGDVLVVSADVFKDGHDKLSVMLMLRRHDEQAWQEIPMTCINPGLDRWQGQALLTENTAYVYTIEAWSDVFESWRDEVGKKLAANVDVTLELIEGRDLVEDAAGRADALGKLYFNEILERFAVIDYAQRSALLMSDELSKRIAKWPDRGTASRYDLELEVFVDRVAARYAAWYEMFHRSQGKVPGQPATLKDCELRLPEIRDLGFDVIYFVPVHPIGRSHRKGPDNTLNAGPNDPGSPYAIGSDEGGHTALHKDLGTLDDFRHFVATAASHGMEVALDFAIQCSPDHPWIKDHPDWFRFRPDGTIKYAENPPKKYQDIVNVDFYTVDQEGLWKEILHSLLFWIDLGVKIFRVDNPHTKPVPFWEWLIREIRTSHPDVIFLAEAFTRPPMMRMLAKVGYSQSYTYFTWRNFKHEITEYLTELTQSPVAEYMRPNFFPTTPDILPEFLQNGGRHAFETRFVLAATLSSVYGLYNGYELCENAAVPGKEEYLHSEKYDYKVWDWDRPGNIKPLIAAVNRIRHENAALHELTNLRFYKASDDNILFYGKMTPDRSNMILIAVNLDPFDAHATDLELPLHDMGLFEHDNYIVENLLSGAKHLWSGSRHHVHIGPDNNQALILRILPWHHVDFESPSF